MSIDNFFENIDKKIEEDNVVKERQVSESDKNQIFLKETIVRLTDKVNVYIDNLKQRNIKVDYKISEYMISIKLIYNDGGYTSKILSISRDSKDSSFEITSHFNEKDGKNYNSTSGQTYNSSTWKDELLISSIEECISDFIMYSKSRGGI